MKEKNIQDYIENFEELLSQYTGSKKIILQTIVSNLNAPGENYCSVMLKIDVTLQNLENGNKEILHTVAKCRNRNLNQFFHQVETLQFRKEIDFYREVLPALQGFQREQDIGEVWNIFPKVFAARRNLDGVGEEIDEHAVILLENLKLQGEYMVL